MPRKASPGKDVTTILVSSSRSATRKRARPGPITTSGWWNGCVIRTSWVGAAGRFAFRDELQASGARAIRLAAGRGGGGSAEPGAIVDAAGGDRLANAAANLAARASGLSW